MREPLPDASPRGALRLPAVPLLVAVLGLGLACASGPRVSRPDPDATIDVSGRWNDSDSRAVSEEMIADALARPWLTRHRERRGGRPRVVVGSVRNDSHEHIATETFVKDLERALLNSGQVVFVATAEQRAAIRAERRDQSTHASLDTMKTMGKELGADYLLTGQMNTILDQAGGRQLRFYQVELELVDVESGEVVWIGQKKLRKLIERDRVRW